MSGTVPFEFTKNYKFTVLNNENVWAKAANRILSEKVPIDKATDEMIARIKAVANWNGVRGAWRRARRGMSAVIAAASPAADAPGASNRGRSGGR